jgi:hypothetical protein
MWLKFVRLPRFRARSAGVWRSVLRPTSISLRIEFHTVRVDANTRTVFVLRSGPDSADARVQVESTRDMFHVEHGSRPSPA